MSGMPALAMIAAAPYAVDKLVLDPVSSAYGLYKNIRDDQNEQNDRQVVMDQMKSVAAGNSVDLKAFSKLSNPKAANDAFTELVKMRDYSQTEQARPALSKFQQDYATISGTDNMRFMSDPESRAELQKAGLQFPDTTNPKIATGLQSFIDRGRASEAMRRETGNSNLTDLLDLYGEKGLTEAFSRQKANEEAGVKAKSVADFAQAQQLAAGNLGYIGNGTEKGDYLTAPEIRGMVANDLSRFSLTPEQTNSINTMVDKGISDKWIPSRRKTPKGAVLEQVNPYTGEVKEKVENTTIVNNNDGNGKTKNPVLYQITKPDGRIVQIDATTPAGRDRLNSAIANGERVNKMGTESESTTVMGEDGTTTTRRVTGPKGNVAAPPAKQPAAKQAAKLEEGVSKSGKPMVKVNGVWEYK